MLILSLGAFVEKGMKQIDLERCLMTELIALDDRLQPPQMSALSVLSDLLSLYNVLSLPNTVTVPNKINFAGNIGEKGVSCLTKHVGGASPDGAHSLESNYTNQTDISEVGFCLRMPNTKNREKMKILVLRFFQILLQLKTTTLAIHESFDTISDVEGENIIDTLKRQVENNDSSYESVDTVSDVEGENNDTLKRQVEHDKRCLNSLYKELEEERNASAIAANQAMAMIHMEALQYLRMMEEQAQHDMEALERANDLLTERERELQDVEDELEFYRNYFIEKSEGHMHKEILTLENHVAALGTPKSAKISKLTGNCKPVNDTGKTSWPELLRVPEEVAVSVIARENPKVNVMTVKEGMMVTLDFRCDRV
ncbi:hypothetical protein BUALT_Bualt02G0208800 [Buddleja alternifolia]|uniref:GTD-binding domain-containing protein n=1 Tax=Buddleja alternifolia TaxID=168488 RepID=A0AAV6YCS1_9LAMI|nr:hypothetical protein BUALT_Bualt02G0208800 [Buddleja alternifolia]